MGVDLDSQIVRVRALYGDVSPDENGEHIVPSDIIAGFLHQTKGDEFHAASLACGAIAMSELYLMKVLRTDDLTINGAAAAAEWRLRAEELYKQSQEMKVEDNSGDFMFFPVPDDRAW